MSELITKLETEHQEIYKQLEVFLQELTQMKNTRDDQRLLKTCQELLKYIKQILDEHFREEEEQLFPKLNKSELLTKLIDDHRDIRNKYDKVLTAYSKFTESSNYKQDLLFPAYNLIATINHHAAREDSELFNQNSHAR